MPSYIQPTFKIATVASGCYRRWLGLFNFCGHSLLMAPTRARSLVEHWTHFPRLKTQIVKRSDQAKGFAVLPKRWIVERTIAWLNRCRRLAKDFENLNRNALAFLRLA